MEETIPHILVHCPKAKILCVLILALVGINWVFLSTVGETLLSCCDSCVGKKGLDWLPFFTFFGLFGGK